MSTEPTFRPSEGSFSSGTPEIPSGPPGHTLLGRYFDPLFLAHFHSRKSLLQAGDNLVASLGVLERIFALVGFDGFAIFAGKRVLKADDGAVLYDTVIIASAAKAPVDTTMTNVAAPARSRQELVPMNISF